MRKLRELFDRYRHLLPSLLLGGGFLADIITFRALEPGTTFLLLGGYAFAAAGGIVLGDRGVGPVRKAVPLLLQFAFGSLLSSSFLFYWFGGTLAASWPVMLIMVALMASNEAFRRLFMRPAMQFGVFAFVFFSYCTLLFPYVLRSVSAWVFVLGGAAATVGSLLVAEAVARTDVARRPLLKRMRIVAGSTFGVFMAAYFLNVIPPIPLSIRDAGIYHHVQRSGSDYVLDGEDENFFQQLWPGQTLHLENGGDQRFYAFTAVYAPTDLTTVIAHRWQRWDKAQAAWVDLGPRTTYTTRGGRDGGFRGYTIRTITAAGDYRVIVESERGQELGRLGFTVKE